MIVVKYEEYLNDYRRSNHEKRFSSLTELEDWIFSQMQQDYTDGRGMSFPTVEKCKQLGDTGPGEISFTPRWGGPEFWIHQIENDSGIIFSDGGMTAGQKHWSQAVQDWLAHCDERQRQPKFNFVN